VLVLFAPLKRAVSGTGGSVRTSALPNERNQSHTLPLSLSHHSQHCQNSAMPQIGDLKRLGIIVRPTALVCSTGVIAGSMAGSRKARTADVFCKQVRAAVARSRAARTRCHLGGFQFQDPHVGWLPACAQSAHRTERAPVPGLYACLTILMPTALPWLWRVSRRAMKHNHHRGTFELLLADVEQHFQALALARLRSFAISVVHLPRTRIRMLLSFSRRIA
jgi:hypothetical protein